MNLQELKNHLSKELFGTSASESIHQGKCVSCKLPVLSGVNVFSPAGASEYKISGLCELCFDNITGGSTVKDDILVMQESLDDAAYDFETIKSSNAVNTARLNGYDIVVPRPNELFLDIDSAAASGTFAKNLKKFRMHIGDVFVHEDVPSKSGDPDKRHITLRFERDLDVEERILFQLFLGSDATRELLSYVRFLNSDPIPTLFYEKKRNLLQAAPERLQLTDGGPSDRITNPEGPELGVGFSD